jgi:hypothetical protein
MLKILQSQGSQGFIERICDKLTTIGVEQAFN